METLMRKMKANERRIIERKKRMRNQQNNDGDDAIYDPILDDLKSSKMKASRQGDASSGLDAGLLSLGGIAIHDHHTTTATINEEAEDSQTDKRPLWIQEEEGREGEPLKNVRFLRQRGYSSSEAMAICVSTKSCISPLKQLYNANGADQASVSSTDVPEEVTQSRIEEKEVLLAMFGFVDEDDEAAATFSDMDDENKLDCKLPITSYEPPDRYGSPPPLMLEVYVDNNVAPLYPNRPPVLAITGGGLPEARLKELTKRIHAEALERSTEEPGEPQIFNLIAFVGDTACDIVQEETLELEEERKKKVAEKAAADEARREAQKKDGTTSKPTTFTSEAERRAYAMEVAAAAALLFE